MADEMRIRLAAHLRTTPGGKRIRDLLQAGFNHFVLPESQYCPSGGFECGSLTTVSLGVPFELLRPVLAVHIWFSAVLRTAVPETPVNKHRHAPLGERNVRSDESSVDPDRVIFSEAVSQPMERRT